METPEASDLKAYPTCKICDRGTLMPRKMRRLSGPAVAIGYIFLIPSILGMVGCAILLVVSLLAGVAGAQTSAPTATNAEPAQPEPDNSTAGPAQSNTMQPFTSANGRFSVLFPGPSTQSTQPIRQTTGETTTVYKFSAYGDNGNAKYTAGYADYAPGSVGASPRAFLQVDENFVVAGKTLLTDAVIDLKGIPGRSYTMIDSKGYKYCIHEFMDGTRFYQLSVITPKGDTATQADQFMNSFRIFGDPPTAVTTGQTTAGLAPTARCDAFAPVFQSNDAWSHQPCSVKICTDREYNPTSFSTQQVAICKKAGLWYEPKKPRLKIYEADNGQKFEVNMNGIVRTSLGIMVWGAIDEVGVVAQPFIFDCHGHAIVSNHWIPVPPRSVLGQVEHDVCAMPPGHNRR